jgi:glutamyl endopeptidase
MPAKAQAAPVAPEP